jgi:NodT family efflux transporter outer membrane factor (OMF) lipoprotein
MSDTKRDPRPARLTLAASAGLALVLGGDPALAGARDRTPIRSAESYATTEAFQAPLAAWPSDGWWTELGDPQLDQLMNEGLADAADIRAAAARFDRANAMAGAARSRLTPTVEGQAQAGSEKQTYNYLMPSQAVPQGWNDAGRAGLDFAWELDFWGKNRAALQAARLDAQAAGAEAAAARLAVSTGIAAAYADLARLYTELDTLDDAVSIRGRTVAVMAKRNAQGLENIGAVERAKAAQAAAESERAALNELIVLTKHRIAALMGAGPDRGLAIQRPMIILADNLGLPRNVPAGLLGRRADVTAARLRTEAAASRIKQAKAGFYPNVNLVGMIGVQSLGLGNLFNSGSDYGSVGPAISLPIFNGGRLKAEHRGAEADYAAAVANYDGTLTLALREVADVTTSVRALDERLGRALEAEAHAEAAWNVANNRYAGGLATYLDVLSAEDALVASRRAVAQHQTRAFTLHVALVRALGGGFHA